MLAVQRVAKLEAENRQLQEQVQSLTAAKERATAQVPPTPSLDPVWRVLSAAKRRPPKTGKAEANRPAALQLARLARDKKQLQEELEKLPPTPEVESLQASVAALDQAKRESLRKHAEQSKMRKAAEHKLALCQERLQTTEADVSALKELVARLETELDGARDTNRSLSEELHMLRATSEVHMRLISQGDALHSGLRQRTESPQGASHAAQPSSLHVSDLRAQLDASLLKNAELQGLLRTSDAQVAEYQRILHSLATELQPEVHGTGSSPSPISTKAGRSGSKANAALGAAPSASPPRASRSPVRSVFDTIVATAAKAQQERRSAIAQLGRLQEENRGLAQELSELKRQVKGSRTAQAISDADAQLADLRANEMRRLENEIVRLEQDKKSAAVGSASKLAEVRSELAAELRVAELLKQSEAALQVECAKAKRALQELEAKHRQAVGKIRSLEQDRLNAAVPDELHEATQSSVMHAAISEYIATLNKQLPRVTPLVPAVARLCPSDDPASACSQLSLAAANFDAVVTELESEARKRKASCGDASRLRADLALRVQRSAAYAHKSFSSAGSCTDFALRAALMQKSLSSVNSSTLRSSKSPDSVKGYTISTRCPPARPPACFGLPSHLRLLLLSCYRGVGIV